MNKIFFETYLAGNTILHSKTKSVRKLSRIYTEAPSPAK